MFSFFTCFPLINCDWCFRLGLPNKLGQFYFFLTERQRSCHCIKKKVSCRPITGCFSVKLCFTQTAVKLRSEYLLAAKSDFMPLASLINLLQDKKKVCSALCDRRIFFCNESAQSISRFPITYIHTFVLSSYLMYNYFNLCFIPGCVGKMIFISCRSELIGSDAFLPNKPLFMSTISLARICIVLLPCLVFL